MSFPTAQDVNLPACSPLCPSSGEREAGEAANFKVIELTQLRIRPKSAAAKADALTFDHLSCSKMQLRMQMLAWLVNLSGWQ